MVSLYEATMYINTQHKNKWFLTFLYSSNMIYHFSYLFFTSSVCKMCLHINQLENENVINSNFC